MSSHDRKDVYTRVTERIISDLEQGIRTWMKPWSVEHTAGRITRPLRHNGTPYRGMNILLLWGEAMAKGYTAPIWMTYKQAQETRRQRPQGRARLACGLRQQHHARPRRTRKARTPSAKFPS